MKKPLWRVQYSTRALNSGDNTWLTMLSSLYLRAGSNSKALKKARKIFPAEVQILGVYPVVEISVPVVREP